MHKLTLPAALCVLGLSAASAQAASFSFSGIFEGDDDVQLFDFSVGAASTVTLVSYSYAGGVQADGTIVAAGGFDPILALFDAAGNLIDQFDDGPNPVPADPVTGLEYDTFLDIAVDAGEYTAAIMQYDNFAPANLGQAFARQGDPFFTAGFGCSAGQFCDAEGNNRTAAWAFDILGVDDAVIPNPAPVPLPASAPLLLAGLAAINIVRRRKS